MNFPMIPPNLLASLESFLRKQDEILQILLKLSEQIDKLIGDLNEHNS